MTRTSPNTRLLRLAPALTAVALSACGSSAPIRPAAICRSTQAVTISQTGVVQAGACPLDTDVEVDATAFGDGHQVGASVAAQVLNAAAGTLTRGGNLRIGLYSKDADRGVLVYGGQIPVVGSEDQFTRNDLVVQAQNAISAVIRAAFAPAAPRPAGLRQLQILKGAGSDSGRSLGHAIRGAALSDGNASAAIAITDGWIDVADLNLFREIGREPIRALARRVASMARAGGLPKVGLLAVEDLGQVPAHDRGAHHPATTDKLRSVYHQACLLLRAAHCSTTTAT